MKITNLATNRTTRSKSLLVCLMALFLWACEDNHDTNSNQQQASIQNRTSIEEEKAKYETAVLISGTDGEDITHQLLALKPGQVSDPTITIKIQKIEDSGVFSKKDNHITLNKSNNQTSSSDPLNIITLQFQKGEENCTLEVLAIVEDETNTKTRTIYQSPDEEFQSTNNTTRATSIARNKTFLGLGYDVIKGAYINRNDAKMTRPILDLSKLNIAEAITQGDATQSTWDAKSGESVTTFFSNYNASINVGYKAILFSGNVKTEFKTSKDGSKTNRYAKGYGKHYVKDEFLNNTAPATLRKYFTDDFLSTIQTASAAYILDNFGSHMLARCYQGGSAEFNYSYTGSTLKTDMEVVATVNATFKLFSGGSDFGYKEKISELQNNSYFSSYTHGGNNVSFIDQASFNAGYSNWVNSIKANPDLCGIGDFNQCLIPIWTLVAEVNATKANAILQEFNNRVKNQEKTLGNYSTFITAINAWNQKGTDTPSGYTALVRTDMYSGNHGDVLDANHKAKGDYIRIGYLSQLKDSNHDAIADIVVLRGNNAPAPAGWIKIGYDLNKGAKGEYLYLAYRKVNANDTKAIDFIGSSDTGNPPSNILINSSWSWVKFSGSSEWADINKGCKNSNYIYLTVHKTDFKW